MWLNAQDSFQVVERMNSPTSRDINYNDDYEQIDSSDLFSVQLLKLRVIFFFFSEEIIQLCWS